MYSDYRLADLTQKMKIMQIRPLDVMVTGVTGAGKSTTLNSLFEKCVAKVGNGVEPETMNLTSYMLNDVARFWDTPGLGDGVERDRIHAKKIVDLLYKTYNVDGKYYGWIDMVLIIVEGINRDMGSTYRLLNEIIVPNFQRDRILVAINQSDVAMKGRHWDSYYNRPDDVLENFLNEQALSIQRRVREATGVNIIKPVYYSGEYNYNVNKLMDLIIDNIPTQRRDLITL
ncbi:MAG: 50S ribosome-binding GTPase [Synergistaceae bacterium]|nr:50S ribosome-binding GTPase [Synergistaceae bacterium]